MKLARFRRLVLLSTGAFTLQLLSGCSLEELFQGLLGAP